MTVEADNKGNGPDYRTIHDVDPVEKPHKCGGAICTCGRQGTKRVELDDPDFELETAQDGGIAEAEARIDEQLALIHNQIKSRRPVKPFSVERQRQFEEFIDMFFNSLQTEPNRRIRRLR